MTEATSPHAIHEKMDQISGTLNAILSEVMKGTFASCRVCCIRILQGSSACSTGTPGSMRRRPTFTPQRTIVTTWMWKPSRPPGNVGCCGSTARFEERIRLAKPNGCNPSTAWRKNETFLAA